MNEVWGGEFGSGVWYQHQDYASVRQRLLAGVTDLCVLGLLATVIWWGVAYAANPQTYDQLDVALWASWHISLVVAWLYMTVVKSRWRTLGYRLAGIRSSFKTHASCRRPSEFRDV